MAGSPTKIQLFINHFATIFPIKKCIINEDINFNGCDITHELDGTANISMENYLNDMKPIDVSAQCKKLCL